MIRPIGFSDTLQRSLLGIGDIGTALNQSQQVRNQTTRTNAELPGIKAEGEQKRLGFQQAAQRDLLVNQMSGLQPDDDEGRASLMSKIYALDGKLDMTPDVIKARKAADLTKLKNEPVLSDLEVRSKTTANDQASLDLDTAQKTQPLTLEGHRLKIGGMKLDNQGKGQDVSQSRQLFPSKLADAELQPEKTRAEIGLLGSQSERAKAEAAAGPKVTADQAKVATFGRRVEQAMGEMERIAEGGYDRASVSAGIGQALPNTAKSSSAQQQSQAERNFVNAVLRRESGAVISDQEFDSAEKQYFPRAGDSDETLEQKARNRQQVIEGFRAEAGPAWKNVSAVKVPGAGKEPAKVTTDAEYDALPSGAIFIGGDGKKRRKP